MNNSFYSFYSCPECGWNETDFDGTFYKVVDGKQVFNLCIEDLKETGLPQPDEYYPKISTPIVNNIGKYNWVETWLCPDCNRRFKFENGEI